MHKTKDIKLQRCWRPYCCQLS